MNNDTISLLQECSAGANMAMSAIDQVLEGSFTFCIGCRLSFISFYGIFTVFVCAE